VGAGSVVALTNGRRSQNGREGGAAEQDKKNLWVALAGNTTHGVYSAESKNRGVLRGVRRGGGGPTVF